MTDAHLTWLASAYRDAAATARRDRLDDYRERAARYDAEATRLERRT